jgi:hypothetical protein
MATITSGYIPTDLRVFSRATQSFKKDAMWGTSPWWVRKDKSTVHEIRGRKAFAVDVNSKGYTNLANNWAKATQWKAPGPSRLDLLFEVKHEIYEDVKNDPVTGLRIIGLEIRGQGGRAYKVLTQEGYVYDMREDQLLEAMIEVGIDKGGYVNGEWVWAVVGSQMKLVRVGSTNHTQLVALSKKRASKKIAAKDLVVGTIYSTASGTKQVFLGFVNSDYVKGKGQLWVEVPKYVDITDPEDSKGRQVMEDIVAFARDYYWSLKVTKTHSCKEVEGQINLPDGVINIMRQAWTARVTEAYTHYTNNISQRTWYRADMRKNPSNVRDALVIGTMRPVGSAVILDPEVKRVLDAIAPIIRDYDATPKGDRGRYWTNH